MAAYFFDSSALVKRYAQVTGTAWVRTVAARNYVFLARGTHVEVIAAIERPNEPVRSQRRTRRRLPQASEHTSRLSTRWLTSPVY